MLEKGNKIKKDICVITGLLIILILTTVNLYATPIVNAPKIKRIKEINYHTVKISWEKTNDADGYVVYRNNKTLKTLTGKNQTSVIDKKVEVGNKYKYYIKAYRVYQNKKIYSDKSNTLTGYTSLEIPKLTKIEFWRSGAPYATGEEYGTTWKKIKGADGYQVETKSYGWQGDKEGYIFYSYTQKTQASIQFSDIYKFGFRVRAYHIVNGKRVYGSYCKWIWKKMYYQKALESC